MLRTMLLCASLIAVTLAGCSDSPKAKPDVPDDGFEPTATTGILRGVAVDGAIKPLAGVKVVASTAGQPAVEMRSLDDGSFGADGLEPGTWFLSASKPGYEPVQQSADVVAGEAEPPIIKVLLLDNPALRPYSETLTWRGFVDCSAGVPEVGSLNPCFVLPTSSNVWEQNISVVPSFVQAEMVWKPATAVGTSFWISSFVEGEDLLEPDDFAEAEGKSPLTLAIPGELLAEKGVGSDQPLSLRVFPGTNEPTFFANQAFDVFITVFYGYEPPEGWTFVADGPLLPAE